ncbi:bacterial group 2 Ig-like protein [Prevotella sp. CAG:873]|nr:bacterial group 2 Ig-like protein [Prevotella sp. CAG:873]
MKHMTIRLATIVLMLTTLIPTKAQQTQWLYDGLFYHINDDGTCSVVSTLKTGEIVIPQVAVIEGKNYIVTAILEGAFQSKDKITSIDLPNSVTSIGEYAFLGCTGLTTIKLPDALAKISTGTFSLCTGLTSVALPSALSTIGSEAFYNCTGLISLHLPNLLTSIGDHAFFNCSNLAVIAIPNTLESIGDDAFLNCSKLTSIYLPGTITHIGTGAFSNCTGLTSVIIPNSITALGSSVFSGCSSLASVTLPDALTSIGYHSFSNCAKLKSMTLPPSVTTIDEGAFVNCSELKDINLDRVSQIKYGAFVGCKELLNISILKAKDVNSDAFINCAIVSAVLPYEWTENFKLDFSKTPNLWKVYIGEATASIPPGTFKNNKLLLIYSNAATPPEISTTTFSPDTYDKGILYVPQGCVNAYKGAKVWNLIPDIRELPYQIDISDENVSVDISQSVTLTASVVPAYGPPVQIKWYSLNEDIATVTSEGIVTGVSEGKATIVAFGDGITASKEVSVISVMTPGAVEDIATDTTAEESTFDIYNLQGIRVATGIDNAEFSAAGLAPGIYILVSPHGCRKIKI